MGTEASESKKIPEQTFLFGDIVPGMGTEALPVIPIPKRHTIWRYSPRNGDGSV